MESLALQKAHTDALNIAKEKLETVPMEQRDYTSVTMAISTKKIPEAKAIIREFQEKLHALLTSDPQTKSINLVVNYSPNESRKVNEILILNIRTHDVSGVFGELDRKGNGGDVFALQFTAVAGKVLTYLKASPIQGTSGNLCSKASTISLWNRSVMI